MKNTIVNPLKKTQSFNVFPNVKKHVLAQFLHKNLHSITQVSPNGFLVYTNEEAYPVQDWEVLSDDERNDNPNGLREVTEFDGCIQFENHEYYCFRNN